MTLDPDTAVTVFHAGRFFGCGPLRKVMVVGVKTAYPDGDGVLVFDDATGRVIDVDWRGEAADVVARLTPVVDKGPGRPKLGVVAREITLLPRHWEWLAEQPGGASVTLRKLVEAARKGDDKAATRTAQATANRFMSAMAGNLSGFEEAGRALFAGDKTGFERETQGWPEGIRDYARRLAAPAFV
jgi:hypothetical protein